MNDRESSRLNLQAAALAEIGITPAQASLFNVLHYGLTLPPHDLCRRAAYLDYSIGGRLTEEGNQAALTDCLNKGWLQVMDESAINRLEEETRQEEIVGPIYGFPSTDGVDFTLDGAEQWFRVCLRLWGRVHNTTFAFCDVVHEKSSRYFSSWSKAAAEREQMLEWDSVWAINGPVSVGPWRAQWWRRFDQGYRLDVEQRMKWQGRSSSSGGWIWLGEQHVSRRGVGEILERHNLGWPEWVVLACLERPPRRRMVTRKMKDISLRGKSPLSEAECLDGIESCVRRGWVRRVDKDCAAEIADLVRTDCAVMPFSFDPVEYPRYELDYSVEGASLYRRLAGEIYGQDWEDNLQVENVHFREEHRYCETQEGVDALLEEYARSGEHPTSVRIAQIGPWCVYWWDRFRSGYRLGLTFGEP